MDSQAIHPRNHQYYSSFQGAAKTLPEAVQIFLQQNDLCNGHLDVVPSAINIRNDFTRLMGAMRELAMLRFGNRFERSDNSDSD